MSTEHLLMHLNDIPVEIVRKDIKNLHIGVYPPSGRVRVSAPLHMNDEAIRVALVSHLSWIRKKLSQFVQQVRQWKREMVTGESHFFQGIRYRLNVLEHDYPPSVRIANNTTLELQVRPGTDQEKRLKILEDWYRQHLRQAVLDLVEKWQPLMDVLVSEWRIKKMKTRWGSCNIKARRIWINLELAKKPPSCLEYVVVHEMVHLLEQKHTERFRNFMDHFLPDWQLRRDELNSLPLASTEW
ncbi:SprT family zinc-dependent metalloprotease [Desulfonatronospira sp.]|uniref:M48 family metallopeptidase n=1 Tax=Desulfonatronospira sp. TaxID=1962951 RepID=UPI0025C5F1C9|nr:SprT family zinc-dependent metalloprotease [Desulfonatronospira sp.]